ncbi:MAG: FAD-dependent oxidoreductase [Armatimonadota bacterium]|nr:FAD-dependent oxidoreductase [Armatimonadota bacterium]
MSRPTAYGVIVGSGIRGAGAAYFMARRGWRVHVVEVGEVGGGTSTATNANLAPHNRDPLSPEFGLAMATAAMYASPEADFSADLEFRRCGRVMLAEDVNPLLAVGAYLRAVRRMGGQVWTQTPATRVRVERGRVVEVQTPHDPIATGLVIDAARASAGAVACMAGMPFDITLVWGQLVVTEPVPSRGVGTWNEAAVVLHHHDRTGYAVRFLATRVASGNLLIGRCELAGEAQRRVILEAVAPVLRRGVRFIPAIRDLRVIRIFAGIRPYSPDERAAIGLVPSPLGFALLAGFGDKGIGLSAGTRLLTQALCGERPDLPLEPFDPARFSAREPHIPALKGGPA